VLIRNFLCDKLFRQLKNIQIMSNKVLAFSLGGIIVLFAGIVFGWNWYAKHNPKDQFGYYAYQTPVSESPLPESSLVKKQPSSKEDIKKEQCMRKFDEKVLKNNKVKIQNREVEVSVKDFGKIRLAFFDKDAPKTVENFLRLTDSGFYNCLTFHRISKGFVIQAGDPNGDGTGGVSAFGRKFEDELNPKTESYKMGYKKGVLAMANSGPNTNGSQFFIMLADNESLPKNYTIFGKVIFGMDVVDKIGQVEIVPQMSPNDGAPVAKVVMESVKIVK
jgi:cyclophilin family peptidyl-prolyl cis-trans isomerase